MGTPADARRSLRTLCRNWSPSSPTWVLVIRLRSSRLGGRDLYTLDPLTPRVSSWGQLDRLDNTSLGSIYLQRFGAMVQMYSGSVEDESGPPAYAPSPPLTMPSS